jgi:hypothetical protein
LRPAVELEGEHVLREELGRVPAQLARLEIEDPVCERDDLARRDRRRRVPGQPHRRLHGLGDVPHRRQRLLHIGDLAPRGREGDDRRHAVDDLLVLLVSEPQPQLRANATIVVLGPVVFGEAEEGVAMVTQQERAADPEVPVRDEHPRDRQRVGGWRDDALAHATSAERSTRRYSARDSSSRASCQLTTASIASRT